MRRFIFIIVVAVVTIFSHEVMAEVVTPEVARSTAEEFLSLDSEWQGEGEVSIRVVEQDATPAYYVIEYSEGGWVVVSAQSTSRPVIAYNCTGSYEAPEPMQLLLNVGARRIVETANNEAAVEHRAWRAPRNVAAEIVDVEDIAPMIVLDLDQSHPFDKYCPVYEGQTCLVGCVAVAMAQAMMPLRYPARPVGKFSYTDYLTGYHSIDYDKEAPYDWDAMYASKETGNYDEVARLLYHCGVSIEMQYSPSGSGTYESLVLRSLIDHFGYFAEYLKLEYRYNDDNTWLKTVVHDMARRRVVLYSGSGAMGGHSWNLDGWKKSTQMVHVNWGWGGSGNGYFDINDMKDSYQDMDFPNAQTALMGIGLPTTAPYLLELSTTRFEEGTAAGVALADVIVSCEDPEATFTYELLGPPNVLGVNTVSPYEVRDGKLVSTKTVANTNAFKYLLMTVTNDNTGESIQREFSLQIVEGSAVDAVLSDALSIYPSIAHNTITVETPMANGTYTIHSVAGVQVAGGVLDSYKNQLNIAHLAPGTYILRYEHVEGVGVKTFIKK